MTATVLTLPGWQNSGSGHWMTLWEARHPDWRRVEQADWEWPRRSDWIAALDAAALRTRGPLVLVAHSLGCLTVAHWAATTTDAVRIRHALLVAPPDIERDDLPAALSDFAPAPWTPLPFASTLVASRNDPYCRIERARAFATAWGSEFVALGDCGHINVDAGFGPWPDGLARLQQVL